MAELNSFTVGENPALSASLFNNLQRSQQPLRIHRYQTSVSIPEKDRKFAIFRNIQFG